MVVTDPRRGRTRRLGALGGLAFFAMACAASPSLRELVGGQPVTEPAAMSLLSFCLACIALALVIRSAIGGGRGDEGRGGDGTGRRMRTGDGRRPLRRDLGRD